MRCTRVYVYEEKQMIKRGGRVREWEQRWGNQELQVQLDQDAY